MKKIGVMTLGLTYAGCFLGAGFVSGQEIWQFFGAFGIYGVLGLVLTFLLHFLFGVILIKKRGYLSLSNAVSLIHRTRS